MARRGRGRRPSRRRDYEEEVVVEYYDDDDYYDDDVVYVERRGRRGGGGAAAAVVVALVGLFVAGFVFYFMMGSSRPPRDRVYSGPMARQLVSPRAPAQALTPVQVGKPKIDLQAVEKALWATKSKSKEDFQGWMKSFENEVNAIYFATMRRQQPNADPTTLLSKPVRVAPEREGAGKLLKLIGYQDTNGEQGYQTGSDKLIFTFQQTDAYNKDTRQLGYSLRDSAGYYYRQPGYRYSVPMSLNPYFLGFFLYPTWYATWYRPSFVWYGTPGWYRTGFFYSRYSYYYGLYPGYSMYYRRTYYTRYRPWGWRRGAYFRSRGGRYYYRRGYNPYRSRYRGRYRSGYRNRYRGSYRNRYRSRYRGGSRYRSRFGRGYRGGSRYRSRSYGGSRYRSRSYGGSRYRSRGGKW